MVLVLIRDPSEFAVLSACLRDAGVDLKCEHDVSLAVSRHCDCPAQLVICDADELHWEAALEAFRRIERMPPVVFLTRTVDQRLWLDMLQAGAYDVVAKPYGRQELHWVVKSALRRHNGVAVGASAA